MAEQDGNKKADDEQPPSKPSSPESRLRKSPLSSNQKEKQQQQPSPQKQSPGDSKLARVYKPPLKKKEKESNDKPKEKQQQSEDETNDLLPPPPIIIFSSRSGTTQQVTPPMGQSPVAPNVPDDSPWFGIIVETLISNSKSATIQVKKTTTIGAFKGQIQYQLKIRNFVIYHDHRELGPDDSTLESHGITDSCKVRLHVRAQTGTSDKDSVDVLVRLNQSLKDLKTVMGSQSFVSSVAAEKAKADAAANSRGPSLVMNSKKKAEEDKGTRAKMAKLREKLALRSGKKDEKKKVKKRKSRRDGGIAGQFPLPKEVLMPPSSTESGTGSAEESSDREKIRSPALSVVSTGSCISVFETPHDIGSGPVTAKELSLYFDPPESWERAQFYSNELFEPPTDYEMLEKIRHEFKTLRCALCHARLPIILREMPCRCSKVFCQSHRDPFKHYCPVDLKKVDRTKLEKEIPKATSVTQRQVGDEEDPPPKSSTKKL